MEIWAILIDYTDPKDYDVFVDRLYFVGLNKETVLDQMATVIKNFPKIVYGQLEIDCDRWYFTKPTVWDFVTPDDSVLDVKLINHSALKGDIITHLYFRVALFELNGDNSLVTSIPKEIIEEMGKAVSENFSSVLIKKGDWNEKIDENLENA